MVSSSGKVKKDAAITCKCADVKTPIISHRDVKGLVVCQIMSACFSIRELHDLVVRVVVMTWMCGYANTVGVKP